MTYVSPELQVMEPALKAVQRQTLGFKGGPYADRLDLAVISGYFCSAVSDLADCEENQ